MSDQWVLTEDSLNTLLGWLDPSRERAGRRYEEIRRRLVQFFVCRGCLESEQMADLTIDRVARKVPQIAGDYTGDPALYFYGVARKVHLEYTRKRQATHALAPPPEPDSEETEEEYGCLERCMEGLTQDNRQLVLKYYQDERQMKIDHRRELAHQFGIGMNALRLRVFRIRAVLQKCVLECLQKGFPRNGSEDNAIA
jgi:DNA-directed RNA polymerase specialized sigma24 family protein